MKTVIEIYDGQYHWFERHAWTGGDTPPQNWPVTIMERELVDFFFQESLRESGGLGLWECAGTPALTREQLFKNRALLDAWATRLYPVSFAEVCCPVGFSFLQYFTTIELHYGSHLVGVIPKTYAPYGGVFWREALTKLVSESRLSFKLPELRWQCTLQTCTKSA